MNRRRFLTLAGTGAGAALFTSWHSFFFSPYNPVISRRTVRLPGLPEPMRGLNVVHLSDLHHSPLVPFSYLESCVAMVNELKPDLVFLTGDFITWEQDREQRDLIVETYLPPLTELVRKIQARTGVFAVLGNHDIAVHPRAVSEALEEGGARVLRDERVALHRAGNRLPVVGLGDFGTEGVDLDKAFSGIDADTPTLVLMHNPDLFESWTGHRNGLIFAGHTHGGQVKIPFYGPIFLRSRYGTKFAEGLFKKGDLAMLVNRGLGLIRAPVRFNCRPEISLVTLDRR